MATVDLTDSTQYLMNSAAFQTVKAGKQGNLGKPNDKKLKGVRTKNFSNIMDDLRGVTADDIGPLRELSPSDDAINELMDDVRSAGDDLRKRPLPEEILKYKQAVRNFINYVVKNCYSLEYEEGIPNKHKPNFVGKRNSPEGDKKKGYTKIQVIDKKLEDLAAMLMTSQEDKLTIVKRLEEIRGLLIDLLS